VATWAKPYDQEPVTEGLRTNALAHGHMEGTHMTRGLFPDYLQIVGFKLYDKIFNGLLARFGRFNPFLEDLGPFLRPDLGGKLGVCCQLDAYIKHRLLKP